MHGGYYRVPFANVLDKFDVNAFFGTSPCSAVNDQKDEPGEREEACNNVKDAGQYGCFYDPKVKMCEPMKDAYRQMLKQAYAKQAEEGLVVQHVQPTFRDQLSVLRSVPKDMPSMERVQASVEKLRRFVSAYVSTATTHPLVVEKLRNIVEMIAADPQQAITLLATLKEIAREEDDSLLRQIVRMGEQLAMVAPMLGVAAMTGVALHAAPLAAIVPAVLTPAALALQGDLYDPAPETNLQEALDALAQVQWFDDGIPGIHNLRKALQNYIDTKTYYKGRFNWTKKRYVAFRDAQRQHEGVNALRGMLERPVDRLLGVGPMYTGQFRQAGYGMDRFRF